jgi:hypothetical protein
MAKRVWAVPGMPRKPHPSQLRSLKLLDARGGHWVVATDRPFLGSRLLTTRLLERLARTGMVSATRGSDGLDDPVSFRITRLGYDVLSHLAGASKAA